MPITPEGTSSHITWRELPFLLNNTILKDTDGVFWITRRGIGCPMRWIGITKDGVILSQDLTKRNKKRIYDVCEPRIAKKQLGITFADLQEAPNGSRFVIGIHLVCKTDGRFAATDGKVYDQVVDIFRLCPGERIYTIGFTDDANKHLKQYRPYQQLFSAS